jgi:hypothetical protein
MQQIWGSFHVGVEPKQIHYDNFYTHAASLNNSGFYKAGPTTSVVVRA